MTCKLFQSLLNLQSLSNVEKMPLNRLDYLQYLIRIYALGQGTITNSWSSPSRISSRSVQSNGKVDLYPIDFSQDLTPRLLTDSEGIPMINYANLGTHYNPWFVGHIALGLHSLWNRTRDPELLKQFKKLSDWFVKNAVQTSHGVAWHYHFDYFGGQKKPWKSGLSQAHAISTLIRASQLFDGEVYSDLAILAAKEMTAPYEDGGAALRRDDGTISFEEYYCDPPYTVLNGHLFSTFACYEAAKFFQNASLKKIAESAFKFTEKYLEDYDTGYWSKYSLRKVGKFSDIASSHYHGVHVVQLQVAWHMTGNTVFKNWMKRFHTYQQSRSCRYRALVAKMLVKVISS